MFHSNFNCDHLTGLLKKQNIIARCAIPVIAQYYYKNEKLYYQ